MKDFILKIVRSKFSVLYLILFIGILYTLQEKAIMPLVLKVVESDIFFEKPIEENEPLGKLTEKTTRTSFALTHCQGEIRKSGSVPATTEFMSDQFEAWALGNRQYLIRSNLRFTDPEKGPQVKPFACTIRMTGEDEANPESWTLLGLDMNAIDAN